jgi:hypothetical protein
MPIRAVGSQKTQVKLVFKSTFQVTGCDHVLYEDRPTYNFNETLDTNYRPFV